MRWILPLLLAVGAAAACVAIDWLCWRVASPTQSEPTVTSAPAVPGATNASERKREDTEGDEATDAAA